MMPMSPRLMKTMQGRPHARTAVIAAMVLAALLFAILVPIGLWKGGQSQSVSSDPTLHTTEVEQAERVSSVDPTFSSSTSNAVTDAERALDIVIYVYLPTSSPRNAVPERPVDIKVHFPTPSPKNPVTEPPVDSTISEPTSAPTSEPIDTSKPTLAPVSQPTRAPSPAPTPNPTVSSAIEEVTILPTVSLVSDGDAYVPGLLTVTENNLLLSQGLKSRVLAVTGDPVQYVNGGTSDRDFHDQPDAAAVFVDPRSNNPGGWIYVINSEVRSSNDGGVGAITFNANGEVIDYRMLLEGSTANCGGGITSWKTWVSCEESGNGICIQVDPTGVRQAQGISAGSYRGNFESFAQHFRSEFDPEFFVTEDETDGALLRWVPDAPLNWDDPWSILTGSGSSSWLLLDDPNSGTFTWTTDIGDARDNAESYFPGTEGIDCVGDILYFVSKKRELLFTLNLVSNVFNTTSTQGGSFDAEPDQIKHILGDTSNLLFFTEDGDSSGIHARDGTGQFYTILDALYKDETTSMAFSPDSRRLYFAVQDHGVVFEVSRLDGQPFNAKTINVRYHKQSR